jgi:hypothetical protein
VPKSVRRVIITGGEGGKDGEGGKLGEGDFLEVLDRCRAISVLSAFSAFSALLLPPQYRQRHASAGGLLLQRFGNLPQARRRGALRLRDDDRLALVGERRQVWL